jgi:hypothetical protein
MYIMKASQQERRCLGGCERNGEGGHPHHTEYWCGASRDNAIHCDYTNLIGHEGNQYSTPTPQKFFISQLNDGKYSIKSIATGKYCSDQGPSGMVVCNKDAVHAFEQFDIIPSDPDDQTDQQGKYLIRGGWSKTVTECKTWTCITLQEGKDSDCWRSENPEESCGNAADYSPGPNTVLRVPIGDQMAEEHTHQVTYKSGWCDGMIGTINVKGMVGSDQINVKGTLVCNIDSRGAYTYSSRARQGQPMPETSFVPDNPQTYAFSANSFYLMAA